MPIRPIGSRDPHDPDFYTKVAAGIIPNHKVIKKFGSNPAVGTTPVPIWDAGDNPYPYLDSATILYAASTSANDTLTGTGARTIVVEGLDENWDECQCQVDLDGQTPVQLPGGPHIRVYRAYTETAGSGGYNDGDIYIGYGTFTNGVPDVVLAKITIGTNQTLMAMYSVPLGHTAFLYEYFVTSGKGREVQIDSMVRRFGGVFRLSRRVGLLNYGFHFNNTIPFVLPEKTDLEVRGTAVLATTPVEAGFDLVLVKNLV